jgi:dienelactone hydrolase
VEQEKRRAQLYALLGDLPDRTLPLTARMVSADQGESYVTENLMLSLNGAEEVPALFTRPINAKTPCPAMLFSHSHGGLYKMGKSELVSPAPYGYPVSYAKAMADQGIACLAVDHWCFGERSGRAESVAFKSMLWRGQVMWGMMVYDSLRAVDYLVSRSDVDSARIGAVGISMGSTMSIWTAALDTRIKVCVDLCCLTDFEELERACNLDGHGIYYYVPSLLKYFTMADINALIAPRPHLSTAGIYDRLTPVNGLYKIEKELRDVYTGLGTPDNFILKTYPCGHQETCAMRGDILAFIDRTMLK